MDCSIPEEVIIAINEKEKVIHALHVKVKVEYQKENGELETKMIETVAGRVLFNQHVPEEVGYVNELLTKEETSE